ncbi:vitamin K epoxide reductase family protein [candidate division WWE3 bacterium]|jgi:uncharacterized membrane protein|nr:vitamin K epoxide reductase family protein [candidate division WWE3 bacterium]MBT7350216.1 vitamin K epoxide reductase family protein [candidate division WWE3 bacterium]
MEKKKRIIILILIVAGILVSGYLTSIKLGKEPFSCNLGQCDVVQSSKYSELFGIPLALFGVGYYIALGSLFTAKQKKLTQLWGLWGLIFSSYLTIIELFVLKAICGWCVISFVIIILINLSLTGETAQNDLPSS